MSKREPTPAEVEQWLAEAKECDGCNDYHGRDAGERIAALAKALRAARHTMELVADCLADDSFDSNEAVDALRGALRRSTRKERR